MARTAKPKRVKGPDGSFAVRGKAANGEGSLYQEADGVWRATYWVPGETRPRRVRGRTREEAFRRRLEVVERAVTSTSQSPAHTALNKKSTVSDMALWWLETVARHRVRPSSFGKYEDRVGDRPDPWRRAGWRAAPGAGRPVAIRPPQLVVTENRRRHVCDVALDHGGSSKPRGGRLQRGRSDLADVARHVRPLQPGYDGDLRSTPRSASPGRQPRRRGASSIPTVARTASPMPIQLGDG